MNYGQCQDYLQVILQSGVKFGLGNVRTVLSRLGQPQQKYPCILVAGTNGKGSVCAMLARILSLHGLKVGLYTSPHLVRVEERFRVGEKSISPPRFCRLLSLLRNRVEELVAAGKLPSVPTYFEMLTCLAFLYFAEQRVDIAVLEVGMGGRLDATNVVTPCVSVITTVSRDHQEFLGSTLGQIAAEKAGIIKPGVPAVCGVSGGEAFSVIKKRAEELEAPFSGVFAAREALRAERGRRAYRFLFRWQGRKFVYTPGLRGKHQGKNAAVAIVAALELSQRWRRLDKAQILRGIRETRWAGRLEVVSRRPLVVLDGAHNEAGARVLKTYARDYLPRPRSLVLGIMRDKDIGKVTGLLFPLAKTVFLTTFPYGRAATPDEILSRAPRRRKGVYIEPDPETAVRRALEVTPHRGSLLVTGSLFLVGELKKRIPAWA
jgi:dihydrofolate synthase/folylpolyglutamate synthase